MSKTTQVNCPNCKTIIDVQDILSHQLEDEIQKKYQNQLLDAQKSFDAKIVDLNKEKEAFEEKKKKENELFQERFDKRVREEKKVLQLRLEKQLKEEQQDQFEALQKELNDKSTQIRELNKTKAEILRLKREKEEMKELIEADAQKKINEQLLIEREKIQKTEQEKNELRFKEMQKKLEDQKKLTEEMKRKQEQGSMQLQGEVQELAIEQWLMQQFPLDTVTEIKKGVRGGDCLQVIHTRSQQNCGIIYYESKRTKDFQPSWIEKFKADIRDKGANIGVLITEVMPSDMDRLGMKDGIWICSYEEFKGLCHVLRESVIQVHHAIASQENKGDKMQMLYSFLTSNEFRLQIEAIVEGFSQMKADLDKEKRSMQGHWKRREKQLEKVLLNTNFMYNSIKGIAGNAIQTVAALEMEDDNDGI